MLFTAADYDGFTFSNPEDLRSGPLGQVADYQIVGAPADLQSELGCWLTLPTSIVTQVN